MAAKPLCPLVPIDTSTTASTTMEENDTLSKPNQKFAALCEKEIQAKRAFCELEESWQAEFHRYLSTIEEDVNKDTNLIEWWGVSNWYHFYNIISTD